MNGADDRWLWDRSGPPDAEVARLEDLLRRFAASREPGRPATPPAPAPAEEPVAAPVPARAGAAGARSHGAWRRWLVAALVVAAAVGVWAWPRGARDAAGLHFAVAEQARRLPPGEWFTASADAKSLVLGALGDVAMEPGTRLQVQRVDAEQARLFVEQGRLRAFVSPRAKKRFFQIETPSTVCVDLGCEYVLEVDADGASHVVVTLGEVAFARRDGGEVLVPRGAECRATAAGVGTPRFRDAPADQHRSLDEFDRALGASAAERAARAEVAASECVEARDSLVLWHLLADADGEVRDVARRALFALLGAPGDADLLATDELEAWRRHASPNWW